MNKINFIGIISATKCNPNGDPLLGNRPRTDYDGYGEITDVCIKRKIRNRLQLAGERILLQTHDRIDDGCINVKERANLPEVRKLLSKKKETDAISVLCREFFDVRAFGMVFSMLPFKSTLISGVKGPVTMSMGRSLDIVTIRDIQITRSGNITSEEGRGPETYGMSLPKIDYGAYMFFGGITPFIAQKNGFSDEDAEKLKAAMLDMFQTDASIARPDGSMCVPLLYWIKHESSLGVCNPVLIKKAIKIAKKDGIDSPHRWEDYEVDDHELFEIPKLTIEKYTL